jgi:hypothetical protein
MWRLAAVRQPGPSHDGLESRRQRHHSARHRQLEYPANWTAGLPGLVAPGEKAVFNVAGAADCVVTNAQLFNYFVQGDNGTGGVIQIKSGGSLTTSNSSWTAVGYNRTARTVVEPGGVLNCGSHLWIGHISPAVGTLDINGGTVNVSGQLGLGWTSGTGYVNIRSNGILNLAQFSAAQSINGVASSISNRGP